jgi:hypothetical protein
MTNDEKYDDRTTHEPWSLLSAHVEAALEGVPTRAAAFVRGQWATPGEHRIISTFNLDQDGGPDLTSLHYCVVSSEFAHVACHRRTPARQSIGSASRRNARRSALSAPPRVAERVPTRQPLGRPRMTE